MRPLSDFERFQATALALASIANIDYSMFLKLDKPPMKEEPCLNCGKMKQHNNAFCSAECCKGYKKR